MSESRGDKYYTLRVADPEGNLIDPRDVGTVTPITVNPIEIKSGDSALELNLVQKGSLNTLPIFLVDSSGNQIESFLSVPPSTHRSPIDFTAVYAGVATLTIGTLPFTLTNNSQITHIKVVPVSGATKVYINGAAGVSMRISGGVLTMSGVTGSPFQVTDVYEVGLNEQEKGFDAESNSLLVSVQNPDYGNYLEPTDIISAAQDLTAAFAVLGVAIETKEAKVFRAGIALDINSSVDVRIKVAIIYTDTTLEVPCDPSMWSIRKSTLSTNQDYRELDVDADDFYELVVELGNAVSSLKIYVMAGTVGATAGQIDLAKYALGY